MTLQWETLFLSVLTAVFPGEPGFIGAKDNGGGGDNWSYKTCKAAVKSSPPTKQHLAFYRSDALPVSQPTVSKHWREDYNEKLFSNKLCGRPPQYAPAPCKMTFDLLNLKVVSESRVTWPTSVPILVFLGLSVLNLGPMYATDKRQSSIIA